MTPLPDRLRALLLLRDELRGDDLRAFREELHGAVTDALAQLSIGSALLDGLHPMIIAVDFDGTCVTHEYPKVGRFIGAEAVLHDLVTQGHKLILWTMRSGEYLADAVRWFSERGIPLLGVNENPTQKEWTQSPKAYAQLYIDDAALGIPLCAGLNGERKFVDWDAVRILLWGDQEASIDPGESLGADGKERV